MTKHVVSTTIGIVVGFALGAPIGAYLVLSYLYQLGRAEAAREEEEWGRRGY